MQEIGYTGFGIGFYGSSVQIAATDNVQPSLTEKFISYIHSVLEAGKYNNTIQILYYMLKTLGNPPPIVTIQQPSSG